ncbi:NAD(P)/FAD-dependent oxidoreductase [Ferdinandcohnia sp. Marseille-Q9671]
MRKEKVGVITVKKPKIVILGAGYGGLTTTVNLQKQLGVNEADITLINKNDYHYETTWLHEASAGTLHHDKVRYQVEDVISGHKVKFVKGSVATVNREEKRVILEDDTQVEYDYLVFALGGESETFGIKGLKEYAFTISNVNTSRQLREHIEYQFATYNNEEEKDDTRLTIVVGGAGFTGIEFLGELGNRIPELCREYDVDQNKVKVICVEAAPSALPGFDPELVEYAVNHLERKGVEFKIGTAIKECTPDGIIVGKDDHTEEIKAKTVVWAAGVRGNAVVEASGFEAMRGRVKVDKYLRAPGHDEVFFVGDSSLVINEEINRPYPPTAQIAMQQGAVVAKNIAVLVRGQGELTEFVFDNKGSVCSLGEHDGIGVVFGRKIWGARAAFMKKVVDNRALLIVGGPSLVLKKGKLKFF